MRDKGVIKRRFVEMSLNTPTRTQYVQQIKHCIASHCIIPSAQAQAAATFRHQSVTAVFASTSQSSFLARRSTSFQNWKIWTELINIRINHKTCNTNDRVDGLNARICSDTTHTTLWMQFIVMRHMLYSIFYTYNSISGANINNLKHKRSRSG